MHDNETETKVATVSNMGTLSALISHPEKELYESKHAAECRSLKIRDLASFLICFTILVLK